MSILAEFEGRHAEGEQEVARQRKRLARLNHERTKAKTAYNDDALTLDEFKLEQERISRENAAAQAAIAQWTIEIDAIRRSLDEALSLLTDPYRLYTEAPEGINLMLVQTLCDKIWILDTGVVGLELTAPYTELLTIEASLALHEARTDETAQPADRQGVRVYHRRARGLGGMRRSPEGTWSRPAIERPYGPLPIENQTLPPPGDRVPTCFIWSGWPDLNRRHRRPLRPEHGVSGNDEPTLPATDGPPGQSHPPAWDGLALEWLIWAPCVTLAPDGPRAPSKRSARAVWHWD